LTRQSMLTFVPDPWMDARIKSEHDSERNPPPASTFRGTVGRGVGTAGLRLPSRPT
jgi:hypothetical protein